MRAWFSSASILWKAARLLEVKICLIASGRLGAPNDLASLVRVLMTGEVAPSRGTLSLHISSAHP